MSAKASKAERKQLKQALKQNGLVEQIVWQLLDEKAKDLEIAVCMIWMRGMYNKGLATSTINDVWLNHYLVIRDRYMAQVKDGIANMLLYEELKTAGIKGLEMPEEIA